jgi:hypothetical protein
MGYVGPYYPIYRNLEWMRILATSQFYFVFPSLGVSEEQIFISNEMGKGG